MAPSFVQRSGPSAAELTLKRLREATYEQLSASPERTSNSWQDIPTVVTDADADEAQERPHRPPQPRPFNHQPVRPSSPSPAAQRLPQIAEVPSPPLATRSRTRSRSRQLAHSLQQQHQQQLQYVPLIGATAPIGRPWAASRPPSDQRAATEPQSRPSTRSFFFDPTKVFSHAAERLFEPRRADSAPGREGRTSDRFVAAETCVNFAESLSRGPSQRPAVPSFADGEAPTPLRVGANTAAFSEYTIYEEELAPRVWPRGVPYPTRDESGAVW
jgi:hypothetical protein